MGLHKANKTSWKPNDPRLVGHNWNIGRVPWNKGNSEAMSGENSPRWKGGLPDCKDCGKQLSTRYSKTGLCKKCFFNSDIGRNHSISHLPDKEKISGANNWRWKGGITPQDKLERVKFRMRIRKQVLQRDNYTCQLCGKVGGNLQVDHIQAWAEYVELRFSIDNCRTLCMSCHYEVTYKKPLPSTINNWGNGLKERSVV